MKKRNAAASNLNDFKIENGVLIEYTGAEACVVIPEGVMEIGDAAFACCERLRSVSIPESVTHIGDDAFDECCSLKAVHLPSALRKIGRGVFRTCEKLKEINLPSELKEIGEGAFYGCSSLKNVLLPDGLLSIASMAFADCYSLKSIAIPDSVTSLGCSIFTGEDKNQPPREDENDDDFDECNDDEDQYIFMEYGSLGLSSLKIPSALAGKLDQLFYQDTRPRFVHTDDISSVSPAFRMLVLMGFVEHEQEYSPESQAGYLRYIRANAEDLRKEAANRPALLKLLHREKLISSSDITKILQCIIWRRPWWLEDILQEKIIDAENISLIYTGLKNCNRYKKACRQLEAYAAENGLDISECEAIEFIGNNPLGISNTDFAEAAYEHDLNPYEVTIEEIFEYKVERLCTKLSTRLTGTQYKGRSERCENLHSGMSLSYKPIKNNKGNDVLECFFDGGSVGLITTSGVNELIQYLNMDLISLSIDTELGCYTKSMLERMGLPAKAAEIAISINCEFNQEKIRELMNDK